MLILTRKENQAIHIGNDIVIKIKGIKRGSAQVVIEAPSHIPIHRQEILDRQGILDRQEVSKVIPR